MTEFTAARMVPLLEDHRAWSRRSFGATINREWRAEGLRKHILAELREIEVEPDDVVEYADVFILSMDLAWRINESEPEETAAHLAEALDAKRLPLSTAAMFAILMSGPLPKAADIMAWSIRAAADRGVSSDSFLSALGKKHAVNARREWKVGPENEPILHKAL